MADLKEQKYIIEIAKAQGISKAAENLFVSQPALSKFLMRTEENYGIQLFERSGKKLIPTYAGKQYLKYAEQILDLEKNFHSQIEDIRTLKKGALTIGSTLGRGKTIFPYILPAFEKRYPGCELKVVQDNAVGLTEKLRAGAIDVALMAVDPDDAVLREFCVEHIAYEEISLITPKDIQLQGAAKYGFTHPWVDIRQFAGKRFMILDSGYRLRSEADKIIRGADVSFNLMEFSSIDTIWLLVSEGFGIAVASDFSPINDEVKIYSVGSRPIRWDFIALTRIGGYVSEPVQEIISITKEMFGKKQ